MKTNGFRIAAEAIGYVFRTDCPAEGWSYIGQSSRLTPEHLQGYFGSGAAITDAIAKHGTSGLTKTLLAASESPIKLDYLEMLHIAEARRDGALLLNGDFGGPRPFPVLQRALRSTAPKVIAAATNPRQFHQALMTHRAMVEQAIMEARSVSVDDFYAGMERDLRSTEDLSHRCPTCGSPAGAVCRTNSKSKTLPRNPSRNHAKRPRAER